MSNGTQVAQATAVVLVDDRQSGTAVLIDTRYLLTAAHVLKRANGRVSKEVVVVFPSIVGREPATARAPVVPLPPSSGPGLADAVVLDLGQHPPEWLPSPLTLSPTRRVPAQVRVFGFPRGERELKGVWRKFGTSHVTAVGTVQLDWLQEAGTQVGDSGGPVLDANSDTVVGVLVEGSERGKFDRFVPASVIADSWPELPRPWLLTGQDASAAAEHFHLRARGQRSQARGGDLFRGRQAALDVVRQWLTSDNTPGRPLVITGQPGAGKSAVLARAVLDLQAEGVGPGVAVHARGTNLTSLLVAVADSTGVERADSTRDLINALKGRGDERWIVVVDALDEASTASDRREIARLLSELAALPALRVVVATRALVPGVGASRYRLGDLLPTLGVTSPASPNLVDLDEDRFFEPAGIQGYAAALLMQSGAEVPGPPGHAWAAYRADVQLCERLAALIATRADRNYLVAAMVADRLSTELNVVDPDHPAFDPAVIPTSVGEALDKYVDGLEGRRRVRVLGMLTALAYARGTGIGDGLWLEFSAALGYHLGVEDLDELHDSAAADFLIQHSAGSNGSPTTLLFHQALSDELLKRRRDRIGDERVLLNVLLPSSGRGWAEASGYARTYAGDHASTCNRLPELLNDPEYLGVADLSRLLPLLPVSPEPSVAPIVTVLRQLAVSAVRLPPSRRVALLALTAAGDGLSELHRRLASACRAAIVVRWAHPLGTPHQRLTGHTGGVQAVAVSRIASRDLIVSCARDGEVRIWDAVTGQPIGDPLKHNGSIHSIATGRAGGRDIIVSCGGETSVTWDALTGERIGEARRDDLWSEVSSLAVGRIDERFVIVYGCKDGLVRVRDAVTGQPVRRELKHREEWMPAAAERLIVAVGRAGGRDIIVSGGGEGNVKIWDAVTGQAMGDPLRHPANLVAVAVGRAGGRDIIVSGSGDGNVKVSDAVTGQAFGDPLPPIDGLVAVALGQAGDRDIIVSADSYARVLIWDAVSRQPIGAPLTGHLDTVRSVAVGRARDRDIIVSGSEDKTVRVWDALAPIPVGHPLTGHAEMVTSVAVGRVADGDILVSGSLDGTVRIWDAATGQPMGDALPHHAGPVLSVAIGRAGDRDIIISGGTDTTVQIRDALTGNHKSRRVTEQWVFSVAIGRAGDRDIIISGGDGGKLGIWDPGTGEPVGRLHGHTNTVNSVAVGRAGDRDIIVSGDATGTVRVWDAVSRRRIGVTLTDHTGQVFSVAVGRAGDRDIVVSGGEDQTVRVWDAITPGPIGHPLAHSGAVRAVALGQVGGREIIASGCDDGTVWIWDLEGRLVDTIDILVPVLDMALSSGGHLYVAAGKAICAFGPPGAIAS